MPRELLHPPARRPDPGAGSINDAFHTSEDVFGRVRGKPCITAGNIAKYAPHHGVIIFNNSSPWDFGCSEVAAYLETGWKWMKKAHDFACGDTGDLSSDIGAMEFYGANVICSNPFHAAEALKKGPY